MATVPVTVPVGSSNCALMIVGYKVAHIGHCKDMQVMYHTCV